MHTDQSISHARPGDDVLRMCRIALQLVPKVPHVNAQIVVVLRLRWPPHFTEQMLMSEHASRMAHRCREKPVFDRAEMNDPMIPHHRSLTEIDYHKAEANLRRSDATAVLPAQVRTNTRASSHACDGRKHRSGRLPAAGCRDVRLVQPPRC
jgi:hypothetical protein